MTRRDKLIVRGIVLVSVLAFGCDQDTAIGRSGGTGGSDAHPDGSTQA